MTRNGRDTFSLAALEVFYVVLLESLLVSMVT